MPRMITVPWLASGASVPRAHAWKLLVRVASTHPELSYEELSAAFAAVHDFLGNQLLTGRN